jgi:hypothetical protein
MLKGSSGRPDILVIEPNVSPVAVETEVLPAATHLTDSMMAGAHPTVKFEEHGRPSTTEDSRVKSFYFARAPHWDGGRHSQWL